jgi:integrating conjugative element membrane protein (TIGR03747 family)
MALDDGQGRGIRLGALGWLMLSPVVALLVLCLYTVFLWTDGADGLRRLAAQDAAQVATVFGARASIPMALAASLYRQTDTMTGEAAGTAPADALGEWSRRVRDGMASYLETLKLALWLVALRLGVLLLALPAFMLAAGLGLVDGLAQRYLRRAGVARESSFLYHRAKHVSIAVLLMTCLVYLALPVSLEPRAILLPAAVVSGLALRVTAAYFKKYL